MVVEAPVLLVVLQEAPVVQEVAQAVAVESTQIRCGEYDGRRTASSASAAFLRTGEWQRGAQLAMGLRAMTRSSCDMSKLASQVSTVKAA